MKVLFICQRDWANHSYIMTQCLKKVGIEAIAVTTHANKLHFPEQAIKCNDPNKLNEYTRETDVIVFMHSQFIGTNVDLKTKKVLVFHTGSRYRQHPTEMNSLFDPIVDVTLTAADTFNLCGKNEKYVVVPVDTEKLQPIYNTNNLIIAHYPSGNKGKDIICSVMEEFDVEFRYSNEVVSWEQNIQRLSECDIYIEDLRQKQRNRVTSGFGLTALEAASLGKIVVTRLIYKEKYEEEIGKCAIQVANNKEELYNVIKNLISLNPDQILELKRQSRKWVENCHSYKVVGNMFKTIFNEIKK